jgi:hypothetical protein
VLQYSAELLGPLTGLTGLQELSLQPGGGSTGGMEVVSRLTGLRKVSLWDPSPDDGMLLEIGQLRQLTHLRYGCASSAAGMTCGRLISLR